MYITPSDVISLVERDRAKINKRFEMLRTAAHELIAMDIPEEEYLKLKPIQNSRKYPRTTCHYNLMSETTGGKWVESCMDCMKMLKAFKTGRRKPSEETIKSVTDIFISHFCYTSDMLPSETLEYLDADKADTNQKLDELEYVCKVMKRYGVTDSDYGRAYAKYTFHDNYVLDALEIAFSKPLAEAVDLAHYVEDSDFKPYKSWWDKLVRGREMDATLRATLNRILEIYVRITNK